MDRGGMSTSDVRLHAFSSGGSGLWVGEFVCLFCLVLSFVCVCLLLVENRGKGGENNHKNIKSIAKLILKAGKGVCWG